eukprot:4503690-Ditylum_brightwellii.AAC.1
MAQRNIFQLIDDCKYVRVLTLLKNQPDTSTQKGDDGRTPLHCACGYRAHVEVVDVLLRAWPEAAKEKDNLGCTPLHWACSYRTQVEVMDVLLHACPDAVKQKNSYGRTLLFEACISGASFEVVKLLLSSWLSYKEYTTNDAILSLTHDILSQEEEDYRFTEY